MADVVIDDAMHVQLGRNGLVDRAWELEGLVMLVPRLALSEDSAVAHVQGRKQRRGAIAKVVVRDTLDVPESHWQRRLSSFVRLAPTLLVYAQHQRVLRRIQLQPRDVAQLLDEGRIRGRLGALGAMRLQSEQPKVAAKVGRRDASLGRDQAHALACGAIAGLRVKRLEDQSGNTGVGNRSQLAMAQFVQAHDPLSQEGAALLTDRSAHQLRALGDRAVPLARSCCAHDAHTRRHCRRQRARADHRTLLCVLVSYERQAVFCRPIGMVVSPFE